MVRDFDKTYKLFGKKFIVYNGCTLHFCATGCYEGNMGQLLYDEYICFAEKRSTFCCGVDSNNRNYRDREKV